MKLAFALNALVAALLPKTVNQDKVTEACEAYRNGMTLVEADTKQDRKLRITGGSGNKVADERESIRFHRTGTDNVVARFIAYNDEVRVVSERAAKFEGTVSLAQIPSEFGTWIAKFDSAAPKAAKKAESAPASNGTRTTKVKAEVPSLAAPVTA